MILKVSNLDVSLSERKILREVSFSLKKGEFLGIVGPNGSGKTTLLRTISGVITSDKGTIYLRGKDLQKMSRREIARRIAVVPQNTFINFPFTALEVVLMARNPYLGRFEREDKEGGEKARESMELTSTWSFRNRQVTELSGGELQRIVIARALAQQPKLLLLDEPTAHLDINHEFEILSLLTQLNEESQLTLILVTHNLNLAARYCRRLILLKNGSILAQGETEEVLTSENIRRLYHINALVKKHPLTGTLYTIPLSREDQRTPKERKKQVHLVCGGGSGSALMRRLIDEGYRVSAGVINVLDVDQETADFLEVPTVVEAPFSPITEEAHRRNLEVMKNSEIVVLTNIPFGPGNLLNLRATLEASKKGIRVIVMEMTPEQKRDFTQGEATDLLRCLKERETTFVKNIEEVISIIHR